MSFKTTYILFGVFCLLLLAFGVALWLSPPEDISEFVLPSMHSAAHPLKPEDVEVVEIERNRPTAEKLVFTRDPETKKWRITEPHSYRADAFAVDDLVRQVYSSSRDPRSENLTDFGKAGLQPPAEVITLKKGGETKTLSVGDQSPGTESAVLYVTSSDRPKEVLAVRKRDLDAVLKPLADFRSKDLLSGSPSDIQSLTLSAGAKGPIELKKAGDAADRWVYVQPPYGRANTDSAGAAADTTKAPGDVQALLSDLTGLRVENSSDFVSDDTQDLAKYHLDPKSNPLKVVIDRTDEISTSTPAGEEPKKERKTSQHILWVGVAKKVDDKSDQYYAMLDDEKSVVKVSAKKVEPLMKLLDNVGALRDKNLVDTGGFKKIDAIDVKNTYGLLEFRHPSESTPDFRQGSENRGWKLYRDDKAQSVDEQAIGQLISQLTQKNVVERFIDDPKQKAQLGLDKPDIVVTVWLESLARPEEAKADKDKGKDVEKKASKPKLKEGSKPAVTLRFGHKVGNAVAVERQFGDEPAGTIVEVPDRVLDQVRKSPLDYLDRELPKFSTGFEGFKDVTKVLIQRGSDTVEVARDKPELPWKITKLPEKTAQTADAHAVEDLLRSLNDLKPARLVAEKATAAQLDEYGLKAPANKVVVTLTRDGKPQTFEYAFGKDAGQGMLYAKASASDLVVTVPSSVLGTLGKELQDLTVFHFDVAKVNEVKMTGWQEVLGGPGELLLKRKDGAWVVEKSPTKLDLNAEKLDAFLRELSQLRAERFVAHKATPSPDQGLDVAKGGFAVEVKVEGDKQPFTVTVGKPDGANSYFATSDRLPGDIFDVPKRIFEGPRSKPAYFSK
jgi:hypothetical protein